MKLKKRGVAYTIAAIGILMVAMIGFAAKTEYRLRENIFVIETRIATMNDFMKDVQKDLTRGMNIASYRALLAILQVETTKGSFVKESKSAFIEAFMYGSINNTQVDIVQNASFSNWTERIKEQASKIGLSVDFSVMNLSIEHVSPWEISVNATVSINMSDSKNTAKWTAFRNLSTIISIKGLEDPVYVINTYSRVSNIITETDVDFSTLQNLERHINNSFYMASSAAPSYLMRLQGDLASSQNGIESIVNLNELSQQELQILTRSNVDYIYFGNYSHSSCQINETRNGDFSFFRLDNDIEPLNHLDNYGVNCVSQ